MAERDTPEPGSDELLRAAQDELAGYQVPGNPDETELGAADGADGLTDSPAGNGEPPEVTPAGSSPSSGRSGVPVEPPQSGVSDDDPYAELAELRYYTPSQPVTGEDNVLSDRSPWWESKWIRVAAAVAVAVAVAGRILLSWSADSGPPSVSRQEAIAGFADGMLRSELGWVTNESEARCWAGDFIARMGGVEAAVAADYALFESDGDSAVLGPDAYRYWESYVASLVDCVDIHARLMEALVVEGGIDPEVARCVTTEITEEQMAWASVNAAGVPEVQLRATDGMQAFSQARASCGLAP